MWPSPEITVTLNYGSCFRWARTGTYMDLKLTTVQQRGQNHQSRTRASNSNRAKSNHSTQVPSDWNIHTLISCTCHTTHTSTFSSLGTHNGWELTVWQLWLLATYHELLHCCYSHMLWRRWWWDWRCRIVHCSGWPEPRSICNHQTESEEDEPVPAHLLLSSATTIILSCEPSLYSMLEQFKPHLSITFGYLFHSSQYSLDS